MESAQEKQSIIILIQHNKIHLQKKATIIAKWKQGYSSKCQSEAPGCNGLIYQFTE